VKKERFRPEIREEEEIVVELEVELENPKKGAAEYTSYT
jgi:hypothetical protein